MKPKAASNNLDSAENVFGAVREIASLITATSDYQTLLGLIVDTVCERLLWSRCAILVIDRQKALTRVEAVSDHDTQMIEQVGLGWDLATSPALNALNLKSPVILSSDDEHKRFKNHHEFASKHCLHTSIYIPLSSRDIDGNEMVMTVSAREKINAMSVDLEALGTISHLISISVEKFNLFETEKRRNSKLRELIDRNSQTIAGVIAGSKLSDTVKRIRLQLELPFVIYDRISDQFSWSKNDDKKLSLGLINSPEELTLLEDAVKSYFEENVETNDFESTVSLKIPEQNNTHVIESLLLPLELDKQVIGGLAVFTDKKSLSDFQQLVIQSAQFSIATHLMRTYAQWSDKNTEISAFFGQLLEGGWTDNRHMTQLADKIGVNIFSLSRLIAIDLDNLTSESLPLKRLVDSITNQILPTGITFLHNRVLFVFISGKVVTDNGFVINLAEKIKKQIEWSIESAPAISVGSVCEKPKNLPLAWNECVETLRLAKLYRKTGIIDKENFGSFAALVSAIGQDAVERYQSEILVPLKDYDQSKGLALLGCAEVFINEGCRYQAAADKLQLHVSTLRYRLKRLFELFNLDLEGNEDDRFKLSLALRINRLMK